MSKLTDLRNRRKQRVRSSIRKAAIGRPRLSVFRSNKNIYAQVIDDGQGVTLASASTKDEAISGSIKSGGGKEAAAAVGKLIAERATGKGITNVIFDRGSYIYHGRVKALADAAREGGLSF